MTTLYRNTRSGRVRFLQILAWAATLGFVVLGITGLLPDAAPGAFIVSAIMAPLFALMAFGMEIYLRDYVAGLSATSDGLAIERLSTFGRTQAIVPWADVVFGGERHEITDDEDAVNIDNLSHTLFIRGKALIVDTTEDTLDVAALCAALKR